MKVTAQYKGHKKTFFTRKDWKDGKKLYMYHYRERKMSGNWYNDPGYDYMAWDDYYREFDRQQRGEKIPLDDWEIEMKNIVEKYNDYILELMQIGLVEINLDHIETSFERHCILKDVYKIMEEEYGYEVIRDDIIDILDIRTFEEVVEDNLNYWEVGNLPIEYINKKAMVEGDADYTKVGNRYWKNAFFIENYDDTYLLENGYIKIKNKELNDKVIQ